MQYPELPVIAFLAAFLVLIPLPLHWRARNIATLALIFWLFITDVIYGVNAIVWAGNVGDHIPIWCDISESCLASRCNENKELKATRSSYQIRRRRIVCLTTLHDVHMQTSRDGFFL